MILFLQTIPVDEAIRKAVALTPVMPVEEVRLSEAHTRVLASDIRADIDIPGFNRSSVDGFAVLASDTTGSGEAVPAMLTLVGSIEMGMGDLLELNPGECAYVPTGARVPDGADSVVMIEYCDRVGDVVLVKRAVAPGENLVRRGEDFAYSEVVLHQGRRLSPQDMGVLAAVGCVSVPVRKRPRIGIISTGNELISVHERPISGEIRDVNSYLCKGFVQLYSCQASCYGIIPDDKVSLLPAVNLAAEECDAVIISGGSSKDERDITASVIGELGEVVVHGVAISPGKPTIIGRVGKTPVIGLPGHPASAYIVLFVIVHHLLTAMCGENDRQRPVRTAILSQNIPSSRGREEYVRVRISSGVADPIYGKSGLLNTLVQSDGVVSIPAGCEGYEKGDTVEVLLWENGT
jgi:molybdopterin molybdotransferase